MMAAGLRHQRAVHIAHMRLQESGSEDANIAHSILAKRNEHEQSRSHRLAGGGLLRHHSRGDFCQSASIPAHDFQLLDLCSVPNMTSSDPLFWSWATSKNG